PGGECIQDDQAARQTAAQCLDTPDHDLSESRVAVGWSEGKGRLEAAPEGDADSSLAVRRPHVLGKGLETDLDLAFPPAKRRAAILTHIDNDLVTPAAVHFVAHVPDTVQPFDGDRSTVIQTGIQ